jgi:GNAT superfamily N-acetyltransferase
MNASICSYQTIELGPQHQGDVARLLLDLDPASRVSRFNCAVCDAVLIRHSQQALMATCWLAGIFIGGDLRGIVEAYEMNPHGLIELAFLVDRTWRRRRLGTALLEAAVQWAAESDRVLLRMVFSSNNWPMRKLASSARAGLDLAFDQVVADIPIARVARVSERTSATVR